MTYCFQLFGVNWGTERGGSWKDPWLMSPGLVLVHFSIPSFDTLSRFPRASAPPRHTDWLGVPGPERYWTSRVCLLKYDTLLSVCRCGIACLSLIVRSPVCLLLWDHLSLSHCGIPCLFLTVGSPVFLSLWDHLSLSHCRIPMSLKSPSLSVLIRSRSWLWCRCPVLCNLFSAFDYSKSQINALLLCIFVVWQYPWKRKTCLLPFFSLFWLLILLSIEVHTCWGLILIQRNGFTCIANLYDLWCWI